MATYTITTAQNITQLTAKGGADTYNVNGGTLTIDCDSRYGPNQSTSAVLGNITISTTLGGALIFRGSNVRLVQYSLAAGLVPASGTTITQGGVTAELLCVMSARTGGTVSAAGTAIPASGWLKVRNVAGGEFSAGLFTAGLAGTCSGASEQGWIVLVGRETLTHSHPRLGQMTVDGAWFSVGATNGTRGQTLQLPHFTADAQTHYPGIEIETAPGSGVYEFWANVGPKFTSAKQSTDTRCRFVYISTTGLVTIGMGTDAAAAGQLPVTGCAVRVPNIILQNSLAADNLTNAAPNVTMGTRYECSFTSAGRLTHNCSTGVWYWNIVQPYSVYIRDMHTADQFLLAEAATPPDIDRIHVGLSTIVTPLASQSIIFQQCYKGGTVGEMSGVRAEGISTSGYSVNITNLYGGWAFAKIRAAYAEDVTAVSAPLFFNTCDDVTLDLAQTLGKRVLISACNRTKIKRHQYADNLKITTGTAVATNGVEIMSQSSDCSVENFENWPGVADVHPYSGLFFANTAKNCSFRYAGTAAAPYNTGTANKTGYVFSDGGNNSGLRLQRVWVNDLRIGLSGSNNTTVKHFMENCYCTNANLNQSPNQMIASIRGNRQNSGGVPTSYISVYDTHFWDAYTSDTTARAAVAMVEQAATTGNYVIDAGNPRFTSQGSLVMQAVGDRITWTWSYFILGWTGLTTMASTGTNTANHLFEYDLDKGAGFSGTWKTLSNANLAAETGISATTGFKPKIRATVTIANTTNALTSITINGTTTKAIQDAALYPLSYAALTVTGLLTGSTVAVFLGTPAAGALPISQFTATGATASVEYPYDSAATTYTLRVRKAGYDCIDLVYANALAITVPVAQQLNADGFGIAVYGRGAGSTSAFVTMDAAAQRIDIGNARCVAEDVYNAVADWQATSTGMRYPEALRFDGTDLLLLGSWRFRRALAAYTSAGIDALPVIDGNSTGSPDDEANGSVDFRARSVRTYQLSAAPAITATDVAAAVWSYAMTTGNTAESELLSYKTDIATIKAKTATLVNTDISTLATQASITALGSPMQAGSYVAPNNSDIAAIKAKTDTLVNTNISTLATQASITALGSPMQASSYVAPANADIAAIKAKTDTLVNTDMSAMTASLSALGTPMQAGAVVDANITQVNGVTVNGGGTELDPWGP